MLYTGYFSYEIKFLSYEILSLKEFQREFTPEGCLDEVKGFTKRDALSSSKGKPFLRLNILIHCLTETNQK